VTPVTASGVEGGGVLEPPLEEPPVELPPELELLEVDVDEEEVEVELVGDEVLVLVVDDVLELPPEVVGELLFVF